MRLLRPRPGTCARFAVLGLTFHLLAGCATALAPAGGASISSKLIARQLVGGGSDPDTVTRAKQLFVRGMTQAQLDNHQEAIALFEEALRLTPENAAILSAVAGSKEALGDFPAALFYAEQARTREPGNVHYHRQVAQLHLGSGDTRRAAEAYEALLQQFPADVEALYGLARVYTLGSRYDAAVTAYERLIEQHGEDPELRTEILQLYVRQGDEDGMERTLRLLIDQQPDDASFRQMLGELYLQQNRADDAVRVYEEGVADAPADFDLVLALAELYRQRGDTTKADALLQASMQAEDASVPQRMAQAAALYARAEQDADAATTATSLLEQVLDEVPDHAEALVMLGDLRLQAGAYAEAADLLYRALQQNPRDPLLWHQAAAAFLQGGQPARAADVADEGLLLFPGQLPLLRISGYALMDANRNDAAIARFEEALDLLAADAPADGAQRGDLLAALGLLYARKQDYPASDSAYRRAVEADPDNHLALNNYAYSLAERGADLARARTMAERAVALNPEEASYFDTLGWIYFKLDQPEKAREWIGKAVASGRASPTVLEHFGDVLYRLGETAGARQQWQRALEQRPDDAALQQKLKGGTR